jgi:glycosyltransferase involved in cell wall biosynthesis
VTAGDDLVSVVVPVLNGRRFLGDALASIAAQDHPRVEIVVVDDGSTDGSAELVGEWPGARCLRQAHAGLAAARNAGVSASVGSYITFLDADDLMPPDRVRRQLGYLYAHPEVDCVLGQQRLEIVDGVEPPPWATGPGADEFVLPLSALVRRRVFDVVGLFDGALSPHGDDTDWLLRVRDAGLGVVVLDDVVVTRRLHGGNLSYDSAGIQRANFAILRARAARRRETST